MFHAILELQECPARWRRLRKCEQRALLALRRRLWEITPEPPEEAYDDPRHPPPRTWFKEAAGEHVMLAWEGYRLAQLAGSRMRPLRARKPGLVLWEDEVQAVIRTPAAEGRWVCKPERPARWDRRRESIRTGGSPWCSAARLLASGVVAGRK